MCSFFRDDYMKEKNVIYNINQGYEDEEIRVNIPDIIKNDASCTENDRVFAEKDGLNGITFLNKKGEITKF